MEAYIKLYFSTLINLSSRKEPDLSTTKDILTGLINRHAFIKILNEFVSQKKTFDLAMLGIDRFKRVNHSLGHAVGDQILQVIAKQIKESVSEQSIVARIAGDEFAILTPLNDPSTDALNDQCIHSCLAQGFKYQEETLRCYASIGICRHPDHGQKPLDLLRLANNALIEAKHLRSGSYWHEGAITETSLELLALETRIEAAIDNDEFSLVAQPIYNVQDGTLSELEVLLRWSPDNIGYVSPEIFVAIAERMGLSSKLDRYVIRKSLREMSGLATPVAVNLAAPTLYASDFTQFLSQELASVGRRPSQFGIEITERIIANPEQACFTLDSLGEIGIHISIDDFGVGYSSLSILPELPISRLKIDKKFLIEKDKNPRYEEVILGILRMASSLGLESLIEGVEDRSIIPWLKHIGCDYAQGYGLARPDTIDNIITHHIQKK